MEEVGKWADSFVDYLYENKKPVPWEVSHPKQTISGAIMSVAYAGPWNGRLGRSPGAVDGGLTMENVSGKYYVPKHYEARYWTPALHSFLTDWSAVTNEQATRPCGDLELRALECIEYYGRQRGYVICKDVYDDFTECRMQSVQVARWHAMRLEYKKRQYKQLRGQLPEDQVGENGMVTKPMLPNWAIKDPLRTNKTSPIIDPLDD